MNIYVIIFERIGKSCNDIEIRICNAENMDEAIKIAKKHRERYYNKDWTFKVQDISWDEDETAYVYATWK